MAIRRSPGTGGSKAGSRALAGAADRHVVVFGSLRCFMATANRFADAGCASPRKSSGRNRTASSYADRFKRVHELAVQFYPTETPWRDI